MPKEKLLLKLNFPKKPIVSPNKLSVVINVENEALQYPKSIKALIFFKVAFGISKLAPIFP